MLTSEMNWQNRYPGFVYWKGIKIEHLGPMGSGWEDHDDILGEWYSWVEEMILHCEELERLGIPVNGHTVLQYDDWFTGFEKKEDIHWFDYFVYLGDFYLRGEHEIAFLKTTMLKQVPWVEEVIIHIWNKKTHSWTEERCVAYCPDVAYHALTKMGWKHGCKFWGSKSQNIISHSYQDICKCYDHYELPQEYPFLEK